jgi:hypothetical protein
MLRRGSAIVRIEPEEFERPADRVRNPVVRKRPFYRCGVNGLIDCVAEPSSRIREAATVEQRAGAKTKE